MKVIRIVPNLSSEAFVASRDFYAAMFDLVVSVELDDWYLQLMPESDTMLNIGFVKPDHELFAGRTASSGTYGVVLTIHVDDVDEAYERAKQTRRRDRRRDPQRRLWPTPFPRGRPQWAGVERDERPVMVHLHASSRGGTPRPVTRSRRSSTSVEVRCRSRTCRGRLGSTRRRWRCRRARSTVRR